MSEPERAAGTRTFRQHQNRMLKPTYKIEVMTIILIICNYANPHSISAQERQELRILEQVSESHRPKLKSLNT